MIGLVLVRRHVINVMNKYQGDFKIQGRRPKGWSSEAAKAARHDILDDPDMMISTEPNKYGYMNKVKTILNEDFLENGETFI